jgi:glycosyltransferase involved in cell wall biosynthesis
MKLETPAKIGNQRTRILCIESLAGSFENCIRLGVDNKIVKELKFLEKKEGSVDYLSKDFKKFDLGKNIHHIPLPKYAPTLLKNLVYLFSPVFNPKAFKENDVYYIQNISGCFPAVLAKLILRNKRIISKYDWNWAVTFKEKYTYPVYLITKLLEYLSLKGSDIVIASTQRLKKEVNNLAKCREKKVIVIPNWVDHKLFKPAKKKSTRKRPLLISIGRLDEGKNHILFLESVGILKSFIPDIMIIGMGEKHQALLDFAKKNKIRLTIKGGIPNARIPKLLQNAELFVMTSKYEGLPHVLLEAMSCGVPVVGTDVRGINDIIKNNYNGLLCKESPKDIAKAIKHLLNNNELYKKLSKNALKTVKGYSFDKIMEKIYKNLK